MIILIGAGITYKFADLIMYWLILPTESLSINLNLQVLKITSMFTVKLCVALFGGIILGLPVIMYQFWRFVSPAFEDKHGFEIGKSITLRSAGDVLFLTTGIMTQRAVAAADLLNQENISTGVLHVHTLKPFDEQKLLESIEGVRLVVIAEEHVLSGGLGTIVIEVLSDSDLSTTPKIRRVAIPNKFPDKYGSQDNLLASWGLDASSLVKVVRENLIG